MSRLTRSPVPTAQQQLVPWVLKPATIQKRLQEKHDIQKQSYDSSSRPLKPLLPGQVVHLRTSTGHSRLGTVVSLTDEPQSYLVDCEGAVNWRSRQHLLAVRENGPPPAGPYAPPLQFQLPSAMSPTRPCMPHTPPRPSVSTNHRASPTACFPFRSPQASPAPFLPPGSTSHPSGEGGEGWVITRSGRVSRPPDRYGECV